MAYIEFKDVIKEYKMGEVAIKALDNTTCCYCRSKWSRKDHSP